MMKEHRIASGLPPKLDLRVPPSNPSAATGYDRLLALLEELGRRIDAGAVQSADLRQWEKQAIGLLHDREIDLLMRIPDDEEVEPAAVPEFRWRNLRKILLQRKGLSPTACF